MNVEGQHNPKDVECIPVESLEVLPSGADWQSRHLESERRKAEIRDRIHKQAEQGCLINNSSYFKKPARYYSNRL